MVDSNADHMFKEMSEARDRYQAKAMSIPGVFGTSIGIRQVAGKLVAEPAIIFHIEKKRPLQEIPTNGRIPKEIEGFPTDVVDDEPRVIDEAVRTQAADVNDENKYRPLKGGCQIAEGRTSSYGVGTLGCAVKYTGPDNRDAGLHRGNIYVLSCQHVMLGVGNKIHQPLRIGDYIGDVRAAVLDDKVDAAIADIGAYNDGAEPEIIDIGPVKGSYDVMWSDVMPNSGGYPVKKRGRTTGLTSGRLSAASYAGFDRFNTRKPLKDQMVVASVDSQGKFVAGFATHGDSGSVVVNDNCQVIGLLRSVRPDGVSCFVTPIRTVLDALNIEILV